MYESKEYYNFRLQLFKSASFIAFLFIILSFVQNYLSLGLNIVTWFNFILIPLFGIIYILSFRTKLNKLTIPFTILINLSYIFLWFVVGGYKGTAPIFIFIILFVIGIYSRPKYLVLKLSITGLSAIIIFLIQIYYPEYIINTIPEQVRELDFFISFVVILVFFIITVNYFSKRFRLQNDTLEVKTKELQKVNENQDQLYQILSHDLKNPMSALSVGLELIDPQIKDNLDKDSYDLFDALTNSAKQANLLLENILAITRLKTNSLVFKKEEFYLNSALSSDINLLKPAAKQKAITLKNNVKTNNKVYADRNILSIIIRNLISNSIKFTRSGGMVEISEYQKDGRIWICIKDNGKGINNKLLEQILSEKDIESTIGTLGEYGTGIGLKLVIDLIRKSGEKVFINSSLNIGTEIDFSISLSEDKN